MAFIVIGFVTPIVTTSFGAPGAPALSLWTAIFVGIWFCAGLGLHWIARRILLSLKP